jgi:hypothetical protein
MILCGFKGGMKERLIARVGGVQAGGGYLGIAS